MILIVDFGSQTAHLIGQRLQDLGISSKMVAPEKILAHFSKQVKGIIFSGGPASVSEPDAPTVDSKVFTLGVPILGICYGWQLMAQLLGGSVSPTHKEYGPTKVFIDDNRDLFVGLPAEISVIQSHGDSVTQLPRGFAVLAHTQILPLAAVADSQRQLYGLQFHPEASHTQLGNLILRNFAVNLCGETITLQKLDPTGMIAQLREQVGESLVIGAISGGTDSTVAGTLMARAVGKQFIPVYIDSGLMRFDTRARVEKELAALWGLKPVVIEAKKIFLQRLAGVTDPEEKRHIIGGLYIELFEKEMRQHQGEVKFLLQGTTYADVVESRGGKHTALIKSHHNVGGLPKEMKLILSEPIRHLYTKQVRELGLQLGIPKDLVFQQPFPGPGHAVRILGEVTADKLERQVLADQIVVEELKKTVFYEEVFQSWSILTNAQSTAVKGDGRFFGDVVAVRVVNSVDRMTAEWAELPYAVLAQISQRIVNEVPRVSRVVYDITNKPPATMEWE